MKYKNIATKKIVNVSDINAVGICTKTIGMTLVIFKEEGEEITKVMENSRFHSFYEKVIKK